MADNVAVNPGEATNAIDVATVEIGGVHYPVYILGDNAGNLAKVSNGSIATITHQHSQIHQGQGFTHASVATGLASTATKSYLMSTGANPIHIRSFNIQATGAPATVTYFEDVVTSDDGIQLGIGNNNRESSLITNLDLFIDPTITDVGSPLGASLIPAITNQGGNGLDIITGGEWILKPNTKYSFNLTNNDNSAFDYSVVLFVYEPGLA